MRFIGGMGEFNFWFSKYLTKSWVELKLEGSTQWDISTACQYFEKKKRHG